MFRRLPKEVYPLAVAVSVGVGCGVTYGTHVMLRHNDVHVNKSQPPRWQRGENSPNFWYRGNSGK